MIIFTGISERKQGSMVVNDKTGEIVEWDYLELSFISDEFKNSTGFLTITDRADPKTLKLIGAKDFKEALFRKVDISYDATSKKDKDGKARPNIKKLFVDTEAPCMVAPATLAKLIELDQ